MRDYINVECHGLLCCFFNALYVNMAQGWCLFFMVNLFYSQLLYQPDEGLFLQAAHQQAEFKLPEETPGVSVSHQLPGAGIAFYTTQTCLFLYVMSHDFYIL